MAQQGEINQNSLVRGLFTEGTALNYPEGATVQDENFILRSDGTRQRRLGLGEEADAVLGTSGFTGGNLQVFDWDAVGNSGDLNFAVIVTDGKVRIYDKSVDPLSDGEVYTETAYFVNGPGHIGGCAINGKFVLVGMTGGEVKVYEYNGSSVLVTNDSLKVRDIWGVDEEIPTEVRPRNLTGRHAYNLANQGWKFAWAEEMRNATLEGIFGGGFGDYLDQLQDEAWPSNADVPTYGISTTGAGDAKEFYPKFYNNVPFGSTPAAKGSAIVRLTSMSADRADYMERKGFGNYVSLSVLNDYNGTGPRTCASYAGRIFYGGFIKGGNQINDTYPDLSNMICFSQTVTQDDNIFNCYQEADPSDTEGDIVASDGGTIQIAGSGYIYKLIPIGRSLLIFASEGVWELYSTDQIFSADNYQLRKITDVGTHSPKTIVVAESTPFYWTSYGIYTLSKDQVSDSFVAQNVSKDTIQSYFDEIETYNIQDAFGFYDKFEKKVRWLFYLGTEDEESNYNRELILDTRLESWYTNVYPDSSTLDLAGMVSLNAYSRIDTNVNVLIGDDQVVIGTDNVIIPNEVPDRSRRSYKYVVRDSSDSRIKFYEFNDTGFLDYGTTDATAVMVTGPYTGNDTVRRMSSSYVTLQFKKTETGFEFVGGDLVPVNTSSCMIESRWDWTDLSAAGKWNTPVEMYRHRRHYIPANASDTYDDGNTVVTTKSRLRGSGRAIALKIYSSAGKDLSILGWNIQLTQNSKV